MSRSSLFTFFLLAVCATAFSPILPIGKTSSPSTTSLFVAIDTSDIKNGMTVELDNEPYKVLSFSIMKQARGAAKTTIKFKNLIRGTTIENTYRSGEKFETALIEKKAAQFTYKDEVSVLSPFLVLVGFILLIGRSIQWHVPCTYKRGYTIVFVCVFLWLLHWEWLESCQ